MDLASPRTFSLDCERVTVHLTKPRLAASPPSPGGISNEPKMAGRSQREPPGQIIGTILSLHLPVIPDPILDWLINVMPSIRARTRGCHENPGLDG